MMRSRFEVTDLGTKRSAVFFSDSRQDAVEQAFEAGLIKRRSFGRALIMSFKNGGGEVIPAIKHAAESDARGAVDFDRTNGRCIVCVGDRQFDNEGEVE